MKFYVWRWPSDGSWIVTPHKKIYAPSVAVVVLASAATQAGAFAAACSLSRAAAR